MKTLLLILLLGSNVTFADESQIPNELSLSDGFRTCVDIGNVGLAHNLMRSIWDEHYKKRNSFEIAHSSQIKPNTLVIEPASLPGIDDAMWARVELKGRFLVAGVPARAVTATTCAGGCGLSMWTLEFGKLSLENKKRLLTWVHNSPRTIWDSSPETPIKVQFMEATDGAVELFCNVSN